jgi:hypothetical protein
MTAPVRAMEVVTAGEIEKLGQYELYRVVTDLDALHEGFRDRVEELQITRLETDAAGQLQPGYSAKLLCNPPIRSFGRDSLPGMLKATGMALVLVIDDARFAPVKARLALRKRPLRSMVRKARPKWLFTSQKASKNGKKWWSGLTEAQRKRTIKKLCRARDRARRRRAATAKKPSGHVAENGATV